MPEGPYKYFGFVPATLVTDEDSPFWVKTVLNTETGDLEVMRPDDDDIAHADTRFIKALIEHNQITKEEAQEVLDKELDEL